MTRIVPFLLSALLATLSILGYIGYYFLQGMLR